MSSYDYKSYFGSKAAGRTWDVLRYLESCLTGAKDKFDFSAAINDYISFLKETKSNPKAPHRARAQDLYDAYFTGGRHSDKGRANKWKSDIDKSRVKSRTAGKSRSAGVGKSRPSNNARQSRQPPRNGPRVVIHNHQGTLAMGDYNVESVHNYNSNERRTERRGGLNQERETRTAEDQEDEEDEEEGEDQEVGEDQEQDEIQADEEKAEEDYVGGEGEGQGYGEEDQNEDQEKEEDQEELTTTSDTDGTNEEDLRPEGLLSRVRQACKGSKGRFRLAKNIYLEDIFLKYANSLNQLDLAHWLIMDTGNPKLRKCFSDDQWEKVDGHGFMLPGLPHDLDQHIEKFKDVVTTDQCIELSFITDQQWRENNMKDKARIQSSKKTDREKKKALDEIEAELKEQMFLKHWIDRAFEHVISLITETHGLLELSFNEGAMEGLYWIIFDKCFTNLRHLILQRRDISLLAHQNHLNPVLPYAVRYDAILHTRKKNPRLEFLVIEVAKQFDGVDSKKWNEDFTKVCAAGCAMLDRLKKTVHYDPVVMEKLAVAIVVKAGFSSSFGILTCKGPVLYYLRCGGPKEFPRTIETLPALGDLLAAIWKVRELVQLSYNAVASYLAKRPARTDPNCF